MSEQTPMTPTAQIAAIRQRNEAAELVMRRKRGTYLPHDDVLAWQNLSAMLALWDARESALRALVAQWREEVAFQHRAVDVLARELRGHQNSDTVVYLHRAHADAINSCADAVERLLESEQ